MAEITPEQMKERLGNVEQIRDLLFGQKLKVYDQNLDKYDQYCEQIELLLEQIKQELLSQFEQMQNNLHIELRVAIESLEKKLQYLNATSLEEINQYQKMVTTVETNLMHNFGVTINNFNYKHDAIKASFSQAKYNLESEIQDLNQQLSNELEQQLSWLTETKLSRTELAEILFSLCLQIKDQDSQSMPALQAAT